MILEKAYKSISDLNLWFKLQTNGTLVLGDIPELIPLRWNYIKDKWESKIKQELINKVPNYVYPSLLTAHIEEFSDFVTYQRTAINKSNPLSNSATHKRFYAIFDSIELYAIALSPTENDLVEKTKARVKRFIRSHFTLIRDNIVAARDEMADIIGGSDEDYNRIYNRSSVTALVDKNLTTIAEMQVLQATLVSVDYILANIYSIDSVAIDPFELAKKNANNPDFNINSYSSGRLVKLEYGSDLKHLAYRYLGDSDKWIDIAIANGLKPPYVDEVGSKIFLIANGSGNRLNIAGVDDEGNNNIDKFYINQPIFLQSTVEKFPTKRTVVNIVKIPVSDEIVIEVNGDSDLDSYTTADFANIRVYKPNTTNSNQFILIPSNEPLSNDTKGDIPWFLSTSGEDERRAKVDIAIGDDGDINFTPAGDLQVSYGIENAIQAIKLKMIVEQGSLMKQPQFGLTPVAGEKTNDVEVLKQRLANSINGQIASDPRFAQLDLLTIEKAVHQQTGANLFLVKMVVRLAGSGTNIPITFSINPN